MNLSKEENTWTLPCVQNEEKNCPTSTEGHRAIHLAPGPASHPAGGPGGLSPRPPTLPWPPGWRWVCGAAGGRPWPWPPRRRWTAEAEGRWAGWTLGFEVPVCAVLCCAQHSVWVVLRCVVCMCECLSCLCMCMNMCVLCGCKVCVCARAPGA